MYESIRKNSLFSVNQLLRQIACLAILFMLFTLPADAVEEDSSSGMKELLLKDIDELSEIIVQEYISLASKTPQKVWETPAAAYVITATDISRSAATNIPDLLRMVPGLFVGRGDSNTWVIGSRGLATEHTTELLILLDGRETNDLVMGGMFWDILDYPLEDIERIEIIRGPGGTLWGTNSGNGVINIITKHAKDTQGGLISGVAGTDLYKSVFRYGGKMGDDAYYRIYGIYRDADSFKFPNGEDSVDDWSNAKSGFRIDWAPSEKDDVTFQGEIFQNDVWYAWYIPEIDLPEIFPVKSRYEYDKRGLDLQVLWERTLDDDSKIKWHTYYNYFLLDNDFVSKFNYHDIKTNVQYEFTPFSNHEFIVGSGYQLTMDDMTDRTIVYNSSHANDQTGSVFIEDNYSIAEDLLKLSLGIQIQYSDYSDFDYQPSAKLVYTPTEKYTIWASITRSAQHYFPLNYDSSWPNLTTSAPDGIPMLLYVNYSERLKSESILSYELGQRYRATRNLSFDLTAFYTTIYDFITLDADYDRVSYYMDPLPHYVVYEYWGNNINGETYGAELSMTEQITDFWKLMASYSVLDIQFHHKNNSNDFYYYSLENSSPHHQASIQSYFDLTKDVKLDAFLYFIDEIEGWGIPQHGRLDIRLGWKPKNNLEISLVGTNLLDDQTHEAKAVYRKPSEVERGVYVKLTYRF